MPSGVHYVVFFFSSEGEEMKEHFLRVCLIAPHPSQCDKHLGITVCWIYLRQLYPLPTSNAPQHFLSKVQRLRNAAEDPPHLSLR